MPRTNTPSGRTGRPPVTSRAEILAAARQLIDESGWEKLTIRRLAGELGIGATTLYHHIRDKEDLLILLLNEYLGQVPRPELPDDPEERIVVAATTARDALAAWPWAAEILSSDGFIALVDEQALWLVEVILAGAADAGCTPEQTVHVFRSIWYYTVGEILVRAHTAHRRPIPREAITAPLLEHLDLTRLPRLAAVSGLWASVAQRDDYERGVRAFVSGLLAQLAR